MHWYPLLLGIHVSAVTLSLALFVLRGGWMLAGVNWRRWRAALVVPHVVDTVLLASAIGLAVLLRQYPLVDAWLTAKVAGLVAYIGLGMVALKHGRSQRVRAGAWLAALLVFGWIVSVAVTHNPLGVFLIVR
ncbi:MAG: SirB2 family protein [Salinisphaera sp.]|nr:SirB2 family protein [Salinisphaera sp.]